MAERVLIADDDRVVRRVIGAALKQAGFEVCGQVASADEAIELALQTAPELCLLDIYMPGSGIRAAEEICRRLPEAKVVMLTASARDQDLIDSLRAGARGYLPKDIDARFLRETLEKVLEGEVVMPPKLVAKAIRGGRTQGGRLVGLRDGRRVELSATQLELLDMLIDGRTNDEIAERQSVRRTDVEREIAGILALLEVPDTGAAVRLLVRADGP